MQSTAALQRPPSSADTGLLDYHLICAECREEIVARYGVPACEHSRTIGDLMLWWGRHLAAMQDQRQGESTKEPHAFKALYTWRASVSPLACAVA